MGKIVLLAALVYVAWRIYTVLPVRKWIKIAVLALYGLAVVAFGLAITGTLDHLPMGLASATYVFGNSWLIFMLYAFLSGLTFSSIFIVYKLTSIIAIFGVTSVLFLIFALIGKYTKLVDLITSYDIYVDGIVSMVAGDTIVSDLSKNYTSEYITTPISVSTAMDSAPTIDLGTDASDAVYITGDGNYYLLRVGDDILLNGDANVTADNPNTYNDLLTAYNADVEAIDNLYTTLVGYKAENTTNAAAVVVARDQDNGAIQNIVANQLTFTTESARYTSDAAENASYVNSLAQAIDKSIVGGANDAIAASVTDGAIKTALNGKADVSAVEAVATDLATNYSTTEQITNEITGLIATKESNISEQLGYDVTKNPANADEPNSLTSKLKSHDTNIVAAINTNYDAIAEINSSDVMQSGIDATKVTQIATNTAAIATEKSEREAEDLAIRSEFAAADELTLNTAKAYADAGNELAINQSKAYTDERIEKLDKDLSAGVASAVALSSVSVSGVKKGEVSVGGGYGYFNGQSAAALGAAMGLSDRWSINAGAGLSSSDVSFRAGTNYKFKLF